jgi:hypothetical protein
VAPAVFSERDAAIDCESDGAGAALPVKLGLKKRQFFPICHKPAFNEDSGHAGIAEDGKVRSFDAAVRPFQGPDQAPLYGSRNFFGKGRSIRMDKGLNAFGCIE